MARRGQNCGKKAKVQKQCTKEQRKVKGYSQKQWEAQSKNTLHRVVENSGRQKAGTNKTNGTATVSETSMRPAKGIRNKSKRDLQGRHFFAVLLTGTAKKKEPLHSEAVAVCDCPAH
ncbi:hypothetical protein NDU88_005636 [Pleurodeles waltl]|uniref:Uncharacterized protein n=1 Tax=Pleurodeles waltl TaxID=8319 RepID=A0AAV7LLS1_PLEWA|nr:hypothetical protein NDU88_005636 [Pleurodeles waltl]